MRPTSIILTLLALLLPLGPVAAKEPDPKPQRPENFLSDWVSGTARFELYTSFHGWASDTHRLDTEQFEVSIKALSLRQPDAGKARLALATRLVQTFHAKDSSERERLRALHVLGRLATPQGLDILIEQSRSTDQARKIAAIKALGFFGNGASREAFIVYGGRVRYVVLPPAANTAATRALLAAVETARTERPPARLPRSRQSFKQRMSLLRSFRERMSLLSFAVGDALRAHRTLAVAEQLLVTLGDPGALKLDEDTSVELLALCAARVGVKPLLRALPRGSTALRTTIVRALGDCARKEAVKPLLELLSDSEATVAQAARSALMRLSGLEKPPPKADRSFWTRRLGPEGERFDPAGAARPQDLVPGVYQLGA